MKCQAFVLESFSSGSHIEQVLLGFCALPRMFLSDVFFGLYSHPISMDNVTFVQRIFLKLVVEGGVTYWWVY